MLLLVIVHQDSGFTGAGRISGNYVRRADDTFFGIIITITTTDDAFGPCVKLRKVRFTKGLISLWRFEIAEGTIAISTRAPVD
jgi:hypothetical protein